jgi:hypothetical protein
LVQPPVQKARLSDVSDPMPWNTDELDKIAAADDLHISPLRDDSKTYGTPTPDPVGGRRRQPLRPRLQQGYS